MIWEPHIFISTTISISDCGGGTGISSSFLFYLSLQFPCHSPHQMLARVTSSTWTSLPCQLSSPHTIAGMNQHCRSSHPWTKVMFTAYLWTYNHVIAGFSAVFKVAAWTVGANASHIGIVAETLGQLYTAHTRDFLGLRENVALWPTSNFAMTWWLIPLTMVNGLKVSFKDESTPLVPARLCGACETGVEFNLSHCYNWPQWGVMCQLLWICKGLVVNGDWPSTKSPFSDVQKSLFW